MPLRRSVLFYPALSTERWDEALTSGADMIVFDLEDGTVPTRRMEARQAVLPLYTGDRANTDPLRLLRTNHPRTEDGLRDLLAVIDCDTPPDGLILPKIEHAEEVRWVNDLMMPKHPHLELVVLIENPQGIRNARDIACATKGLDGPQVTCLFLGTADYSASIGSDLGWDALASARGATVLAAREAEIDAMDGVWFDPSDEAGLKGEAARIAAMGFTGKASYDAQQIPLIHAAFQPSAEEVDWAERVLAAVAADPLGTARVDGKMVNQSIARRARRVLERR